MDVYNLCHIFLNFGANIPNNYYMEEFSNKYFQKRHKKKRLTPLHHNHLPHPVILYDPKSPM